MKTLKVLNTGKQNEAFAGESDFFLNESEQSKLLGGNDTSASDVQCKKGYKESTWFGGGTKCRCGYVNNN